MDNFNLKNFINENNLGAYSRLKEDTVREQSAFVLAADAARDAGKDEFEFPKGSGKMHKVSLKQDIPVEEGVGGEMVEILGAFFALVTAGKTALEAVKILGDKYGDISISSIKDALKKYKASKNGEVSKKALDIMHQKIDKDIHDTIGLSSDEKKVNEELDEKYDREDGDGHLGTNTDDDFEREQLAQLAARNEEMGMEYEYDDLIGPLMKSMVDMEKWVAKYASDDTEAVQLLQLATNALENFDNYMSYGTEMNEEVKGDFKIGDKVTYLGHPGEVTNVERQMTGATTYSVAYDKGQGRTKVTGIYNKGGEIKPMKENSLNLSDAL